MQGQLKSLCSEWIGKGSSKVTMALDELHYLMDFNSSITQAAAKTMEHLSEFAFISFGNLTLARRVKSGVKPDTVAALRMAPLHISTLFPDSVIKKAERKSLTMKHEDTLALHVARSISSLMTSRTEGRINGRIRKVTSQHGRTLGRVGTESLDPSPQPQHHDQPRANSLTNDNYCVTKFNTRLLAGSTPQTMDSCTFLNVKPLVHYVHTATGHSQKKEISPRAAVCFSTNCALKSVKSAGVTQLSCARPVTNVKNVVSNLPVRARLQNF